jgi:hypothetical protein
MPNATAREFQRASLAYWASYSSDTKEVAPDGNQRDARAATIPAHGSAEIGVPLFNKILRQSGTTLDEFQKLR